MNELTRSHFLKTLHLMLLIGIAIGVCSGCSLSQTGRTNFAVTAVSLKGLYAYDAEEFTFGPIYGAFKLSTSLIEPYTELSDSIQVAAYSDEKCTKAATGTIGATFNPLSFSKGVAKFSGVKYTL